MTEAVVGLLAGIARHARPKGPMEVLDRADVTIDGGIAGDFRGNVKPGGTGRRQVTLIAVSDCALATETVGVAIPWFERRANLLVEGVDLPQRPGTQIVVGPVVLEITRECDPCIRMDALAPGLMKALQSGWRGGVCSRVLRGGAIAVGDDIRIEEP